MNGISHIDASALQHPSHFPERVLRLSHGQAIARNNHHPFSCLEGEGAFLNTAAGDVGVFTAATTCSARGTQGATEQHRHQGTVHAVAHHLGEDQASSANHGAGHDQQLAAHHETGSSGSHTGIAVQQGDHHGHVGAADRQRHPDSQQAGGHHQQPEARARISVAQHLNGTHKGCHRQRNVHGVARLALHPGRRGQPTLQLGHGHDRAGEGDRTHEHGDNDRHHGHRACRIEGRRVKRSSQSHQQ